MRLTDKLYAFRTQPAEYAGILTEKKAAYAEYRKVRDEAQELIIAKRNIASLYEAETREQERQKEEKTH